MYSPQYSFNKNEIKKSIQPQRTLFILNFYKKKDVFHYNLCNLS